VPGAQEGPQVKGVTYQGSKNYSQTADDVATEYDVCEANNGSGCV